MRSNREGAGRLAEVLAGLPADDQEELLDEVEAVLASSGAGEGEYDAVIEAWLAGGWPPPESALAALRDDVPEGCAPDVPAAPAPISLDALRASLQVDGEGVPRLAGGLSDDEVLSWVRRATAVEQQAQWLRSVGIGALAARWTVPDPVPLLDAAAGEAADPRRAGRMRGVRRRLDSPRHSRKVLLAADPTDPGPDPAGGPTIRNTYALGERIKTLLLMLDPRPFAEDAGREREDRRVYSRLISEHTAELVAVLPIGEVAAIAARLDAEAETARTDRDPRTADQVRADVLSRCS